jgi:Golgi phosphoprotein 3 (GPP34)
MHRTAFSLRERLWLLAHDDRYAPLRPLVDVRGINVSLAAATLIDLLIADRIRIAAGAVYVARRHPEPLADPASAAVLAGIDSEQPPLLADLLLAAAADRSADLLPNPFRGGYEHTRTALIVAGQLRQERRRFRSPCYHLVDPQLIESIRQRFNRRLVFHREDADADTDCFCALVLALRLHHGLSLPYQPAEAEQILWAITDDIPRRAGHDAPLAAVPHLVHSVHNVIGDLATAPF